MLPTVPTGRLTGSVYKGIYAASSHPLLVTEL